MENNLLSSVQSAIKNWWMSLIIGILFVGVALWMMFVPIESYVVLSVLFSVCMFVSGLFEIAFAVSNRKIISGWGWYLTAGIIDLILGIFLICSPVVTMTILPLIVAFWLMFRGFSAIGFSMDLNTMGVRGWGWYMVFGILAILCSLMVLWDPAAGALGAVYIVSFAFLFIGVFRIMLSFELQALGKRAKELKEEMKGM